MLSAFCLVAGGTLLKHSALMSGFALAESVHEIAKIRLIVKMKIVHELQGAFKS